MNIIALLRKEAAGAGAYLIMLLTLSTGGDMMLLHLIRSNFRQSPDSPNFRLVLLFLIALGLDLTAKVKARQATVRIIHNLAMHLFEQGAAQLRCAKLAAVETLGRAAVYNTILVDTQKIAQLADDVSAAQAVIFTALSGLAYLLWFAPLAFVLTVGALGGGSLIFFVAFKWIRRQIHSSRKREKKLFHLLRQFIFGFKELKSDAAQMDDFFQRDLTRTIARYKDVRIHAKNLNADAEVLSTLLDYARFIPILFVLPFIASASRLLLPQIVAVMLFIPLHALKATVRQLLLADLAVQRLARLQQTLAKLGREEIQWPAQTPRRFHTLAYHDLTFAYTDQYGEPAFTIGPLNLTLAAGEIVFLTGGNGSGKTTLLKVMLGLYPPLAGRIELDNTVIRIEQHRYLFAAIFTDFHLFERCYGLPDVQPEQVQPLLELMALTPKVQYRDGQFSTQDLSGGQRKRLALIATLLEDKPVYLFDEWAAGQDPEFREYFYLTLLPKFKQEGKTIFAITHDEQYFHAADRMLKLEQGQFVPYEPLIQRRPE